jgi:hypothetical protein
MNVLIAMHYPPSQINRLQGHAGDLLEVSNKTPAFYNKG